MLSGCVVQVVICLPRKQEALRSNTEKKNVIAKESLNLNMWLSESIPFE